MWAEGMVRQGAVLDRRRARATYAVVGMVALTASLAACRTEAPFIAAPVASRRSPAQAAATDISPDEVHFPSGEALFSGAEALPGAVRGHRSRLPREVVRCSGCHTKGEKRAEKSAWGDPSAPPLGRSLLLQPQERRGGPPSSYDRSSFCRVLRTGIDPANIIVGRIMPVYEIDDSQCSRLYRFLTEGA